jgi:glycine/D-amino acid oxidase-like deaminating enzyme
VVPSLWWESLPDTLTRPVGEPLPGDSDADIVIVGGGYTGLWTAYYLKQASPDLRIAVIEAHVAGFGASGRNGGWASALFPASLDALAKSHGRDSAIRMKRTMFETVREIGSVAQTHGWDIDWEYGGTIGVARSPLQWQRAKDEIAHLRSWGFGDEDYALLNASETSAHIHVRDALGAVFTPHCAAIHPAKLVRHLAYHVQGMGVDVYEHTRVLAINKGSVRTDRGVVRAPIIVRATEGYTAALPGLKRAIAPVYSLMLATEPLPAGVLDEIGLQNRETFYDGRNLIIYGQRTIDGRLAFGGRGAPYHFGSTVKDDFDRNPKVHKALWDVLVDFFPAVSAAHVTHTWGGPLGIARDWWASAGFDPHAGLAWAGGYVGDGVGTSNLSGRTLRDLILNRDSDLTSLPWVNHHSRSWEPEPLRWLGTNVGLQVMTYADAKERRFGRSAWTAEVFGRAIGH